MYVYVKKKVIHYRTYLANAQHEPQSVRVNIRKGKRAEIMIIGNKNRRTHTLRKMLVACNRDQIEAIHVSPAKMAC